MVTRAAAAADRAVALHRLDRRLLIHPVADRAAMAASLEGHRRASSGQKTVGRGRGFLRRERTATAPLCRDVDRARLAPTRPAGRADSGPSFGAASCPRRYSRDGLG